MIPLRTPPQLEELGARVLPSATALPFALPPAPSAQQIVMALALAGKGHGHYSYDPIQSGAGVEYQLHGSANLTPLGPVSVSGMVHAVGFIAHGQASGELTFTNAHGALTVKLTGPEQSAFSPLPHKFQYVIAGGTGAYAHLSGHGSLNLVLKPGVVLDPPIGPPIPQGTFTFTIP